MNIPARVRLGKQIKKLRERAKFTQEKLATAVGLDYKYLQKIEGKNPPAIRIDTLEKFAKALKTTPSKLLDF
jgi:transcriptional regulator with XRE-family HTH domain